MRLGVVGCGLIGARRVQHARGHSVAVVTDPIASRAETMAAGIPGCRVASDAAALLAEPDLDAVIIATTHDHLAPLTLAALRGGKHVLVEKPGACRPEELDEVIREAAMRKRVVKVGFNHRFHPALQKAHEIFESGALGPMMFIRGRYGHGGRPGYEKEWRAFEAISGGGEAIDQGVHLIDLSRWFLGDFTTVSGFAPTFFWPMDVEDNAFMQLKTADGRVAWLHTSWTEWKNMFSMEIYGRVGKLQIDGLGGSYGVEKLTYYKMKPEMGPPDVETWDFPGPDSSWALEFEHFESAVNGKASDCADLLDARAALAVAQKVRTFR